MDTHSKLKILADASRYDLSCACGSTEDEHRRRGNDGAWLYPVTLADGGTSIMLKTLLSNACSNDCKYCPFRGEADTPRCTLQPTEIADVFMDYVRREGIFGLFLSSGVVGTPDRTMELLNATASILRKKHSYRGYIHLKVIPGASNAAIEEALGLASAVSLNIETPGKRHFDLLSARKNYEQDIIRPLKLISERTAPGARFSRVRKTTQFIVGAADELDREIVRYTFALYNRLHLNRVYFSAYQRGLGSPEIPGERRTEAAPESRFLREHRLYQVDFLFRKYRFSEEDIPFDSNGNLLLDRDPKLAWADRHPERFPVRANTAGRDNLLRVPGLGPATVSAILKIRTKQRLRRPEHLPLKGKRLALASSYLVFD